MDDTPGDRKSTRLNSSHVSESRMPSSAWKNQFRILLFYNLPHPHSQKNPPPVKHTPTYNSNNPTGMPTRTSIVGLRIPITIFYEIPVTAPHPTTPPTSPIPV